MEDRIFRYALFLSFVAHIIILLRFSYAHIESRSLSVQSLEVVYPRIIAKSNDINPKNQLKNQNVAFKEPARERTEDLESFVKDFSKLSEDFFHATDKPRQNVPNIEKRSVFVPAIENRQIDNPSYLNYYEMVRHRIRERAYANYRLLDSGEVYLSFVVSSSGILREIKILENRTKANQRLRALSFQSVKEAGPFLPFPEDLPYPDLSFNVIILFQVD
jgi:hypothetical protein